MKRILLTLVSLAFCWVLHGQNVPTFHSEKVESSALYIGGNDFQKDLLLYIDMLTATHPYYADAKHCAQLQKKVKKMYKECGKIDDVVQFKVYLAKVASALNDGHTAVVYFNEFETFFPIRFDLDGTGSAVIDICSEEHKELLGKAVKSINGKSINQILALARPLISADNDVSFANTVKEYLMFNKFWSLLGMSEDVLRLILTDGSQVEIPAIKRGELEIAQLQRNSEQRVTAKRSVLFDYEIFEKQSICYLQFNQFADRITHPKHTQLARFDEFISDMMLDMKSKSIQTLVVDLQYNSGGNSILGEVLLSWLYQHKDLQNVGVDVRISELLYAHYPYYKNFTVGGQFLKEGEIYDFWGFDHSKDYKMDYSVPQDPNKHILNLDNDKIFKGNVIFIQGRDSFSSATLLLTLARDNGIGKIIGQRAGGKPCHYGDVLYCQLPQTQTLATVSHKYFRRPNIGLKDMDYIEPDVTIDLGNSEKDLAWEWIVENYGVAAD